MRTGLPCSIACASSRTCARSSRTTPSATRRSVSVGVPAGQLGGINQGWGRAPPRRLGRAARFRSLDHATGCGSARSAISSSNSARARAGRAGDNRGQVGQQRGLLGRGGQRADRDRSPRPCTPPAPRWPAAGGSRRRAAPATPRGVSPPPFHPLGSTRPRPASHTRCSGSPVMRGRASASATGAPIRGSSQTSRSTTSVVCGGCVQQLPEPLRIRQPVEQLVQPVAVDLRADAARRARRGRRRRPAPAAPRPAPRPAAAAWTATTSVASRAAISTGAYPRSSAVTGHPG